MKTFEKIFRKFYPVLVSYATAFLGTQSEAEDIVQEVFLKLWNDKRLQDIKDPSRYLFRMVKNKCIDHLRQEKHKPSLLRLEEPVSPVISNQEKEIWAQEMEVFEEGTDLAAELYREVDRLPPRCREAFLLVKIHGYTYDQAAEIQNISVNMIKKQMQKAFRLLRTRLLDKK